MKQGFKMSSVQISEKVKIRLYPAVLSEFSSKDFHEVNIRDISSVSGVSTGTIYKYFSSKEDLLFSIIDEKLSELGELLRLHIKGMVDVKEIFRKIFWVTMDFFDNNPELAVVAFVTVPLKNFMQSPAYRRQEEVDILNSVVEKARLEGAVNIGVKKRYFVDLYIMISHRHIHNWYYCGSKWKLAETIDDFFNFFWTIVSPLSLRTDGGEK